MDLKVTHSISIPDSELEEHFILSSGAGGQNVNKVASAVQLRFDVLHSRALTDDVRVRLIKLSGHRLTKDGVLIVTARESRDQARNRETARARLADLIRRAAVAPKTRVKTKLPKAAKQRRLDDKKRHGRAKERRRKAYDD